MEDKDKNWWVVSDEDSRIVIIDEEPTNGEQRLNKSTGEVEVYYNGDWCAR